MPSLPALFAASTVGAVGIALVIVALVGDPLDRPRARVPLLLSGVAGGLAVVAAVELAARGRTLGAVAAGGVAACGAAGVVALLRAHPRDDDDGGGGRAADLEPPPDPGGLAVDWPAFEQAFWEHVDGRRCTPSR